MPASSKILATEFQEHERGVANGILDSGNKLGPAIGTLVGGLFIARYGWRPLFVATGVVGLLWLIPWLAVSSSAEDPTQPSGAADDPAAPRLSLQQILLTRRHSTGGFMVFDYGDVHAHGLLPLLGQGATKR